MKFRRKWKHPVPHKPCYQPPDKYSVEIVKQPRSVWPAISAVIGVISVILSFAVTIINVNSYMQNSKVQQENQIYSQARLISTWIYEKSPEDFGIADINNLSNSPVYHVVITSVSIGNGNTTPAENGLRARDNEPDTPNGAYLSILPPGKYKCSIAPIEGASGKRFGLEISFRDVNGRSWILNADGKLSQIKKDPFSYYPVPSPMDYDDLEAQ